MRTQFQIVLVGGILTVGSRLGDLIMTCFIIGVVKNDNALTDGGLEGW